MHLVEVIKDEKLHFLKVPSMHIYHRNPHECYTQCNSIVGKELNYLETCERINY